MFRMLIHPSSGACSYLVRYYVGCIVLTWGMLVLCSGIGKSAQYSLHNNAPSSRKVLKMDVLTSETCWAVNWHNKASVIKLVYLYSNIKMMHGPICIRFSLCIYFFFHLQQYSDLCWIQVSLSQDLFSPVGQRRELKTSISFVRNRNAMCVIVIVVVSDRKRTFEPLIKCCSPLPFSPTIQLCSTFITFV